MAYFDLRYRSTLRWTDGHKRSPITCYYYSYYVQVDDYKCVIPNQEAARWVWQPRMFPEPRQGYYDSWVPRRSINPIRDWTAYSTFRSQKPLYFWSFGWLVLGLIGWHLPFQFNYMRANNLCKFTILYYQTRYFRTGV